MRISTTLAILEISILATILSGCMVPASENRALTEQRSEIIPDRCELPTVPRRKVVERHQYEMADKNGRMYSVVSTKNEPSGRVEYSPTLTRAQIESGTQPEPRELEWFEEVSYNGRIFAVELFGRDLEPRNGNSLHRQLWIWLCVDSDGDRVFEYPTDKKILVPAWVIE